MSARSRIFLHQRALLADAIENCPVALEWVRSSDLLESAHKNIVCRIEIDNGDIGVVCQIEDHLPRGIKKLTSPGIHNTSDFRKALFWLPREIDERF